MEAATNLLDADRSSLFLFDERRKAPVSRVAQGLQEILIHMPVERRVIGAVWSSGQPVLVTDTARDKRFDPSSDQATGYRTESIVAVPLMTKGGRMIGVAEVLNKRQGKFDDRDVDLLCSLAAQAASAIENARLFEEVVATRNYNESILLSEFTVEQLSARHGLREIDAVRVKGKKKPVRIFESLRHCWNDTPGLTESVALTAAGLEHFRSRDWDGAERAFADARKIRADDRVAAMYLARIADYRTTPPPEGWDGVYVMKTK
ncbi:MAG: GAF domain-containing protein [Alphaproteobacteria bacterium]|nr:GAF domain-containing protein [Alphaproteobacteria bacterium]